MTSVFTAKLAQFITTQKLPKELKLLNYTRCEAIQKMNLNSLVGISVFLHHSRHSRCLITKLKKQVQEHARPHKMQEEAKICYFKKCCTFTNNSKLYV